MFWLVAVLIWRILIFFLNLISNEKASAHAHARGTLPKGALRAARRWCFSSLPLSTEVWVTAVLRRENPWFYRSGRRGRPKITTAHLARCFLARRSSAVISCSAPQAPCCGRQRGTAPSRTSSQETKGREGSWAAVGRAGSQTGVWASHGTASVFKETLNTFKVNLITSCYPEKAKYRKK